jgi:hypothetical protein
MHVGSPQYGDPLEYSVWLTMMRDRPFSAPSWVRETPIAQDWLI